MPERDLNKSLPIFFLHPHVHHAFFTVLALSERGPVHVLCPPLSLQLWRNYWRHCGLRLAYPSPRELLANAVAMLAFLAFKSRLLSESFYLLVFRKVSLLFLGGRTQRIVVHYQDYLGISRVHAEEFRICELIIDTNSQQQNCSSTLAAVRNSDVVVAPSRAIAEYFDSEGLAVKLAPYGGDKRSYMANLSPGSSSIDSGAVKSMDIKTNVFRVAVRANSYRKGADLLLQALLLLDCKLTHAPVKSRRKIEILICGSVKEPKLLSSLIEVQESLLFNDLISVTAKQYPQSQYLSLLDSCDCFLMPSRLEGSSYAALEALWQCVPSILSGNCGVDQFRDGRHGLLLENLSGESIANALYTICLSPSLISEWRYHLSTDQALYGWDGYLASYHDLLSKY